MAPKPKKTASELVTMKRDGETLDVHPLCVEEHKRLGWVIADAEPTAENLESEEE